MGRVIIGQKEVVELLVTCLLAGGHALVEGVPGLGKTLLVKSLAQATDMQFRRVQFTPDLMPSDIVGTEILEEDQATRQRVFRFQQGPVFTQVLLADEINRAPPKTQSALLEAMQEAFRHLRRPHAQAAQPFFVLATQNPIEQAGTYPLPEAQLDRFLLRIDVGYPTEDEEIAMVSATTHAGLQRCRAGDGPGQPAAPAAAGARHRDRRAHAALCDAPGARHPSGQETRSRRSASTSAGAPVRAPARRWCWPPRRAP
jgi:MoxR-like ATPase